MCLSEWMSYIWVSAGSEGIRSPGGWNFRWMSCLMWVLGTECGSSGRAASAEPSSQPLFSTFKKKKKVIYLPNQFHPLSSLELLSDSLHFLSVHMPTEFRSSSPVLFSLSTELLIEIGTHQLVSLSLHPVLLPQCWGYMKMLRRLRRPIDFCVWVQAQLLLLGLYSLCYLSSPNIFCFFLIKNSGTGM